MLNIKKIEAAKSKDKPYKLSDSNGLYLYVSTAGGKSWRFDYTFMNNRKTLTIGKYPIVSLATARSELALAKEILFNGKDPASHKKQNSMLSNAQDSKFFKDVADAWYQSKLSSWSPNYAEDVKGWLDTDILPYIGNESIDTIKPLTMLTVLKAIESRGAYEIARKARITCSGIFKYAIITGKAEINPVSELASAMIKPKSKNFPFLAFEHEMKDFMLALKKYSGNRISRLAVELIIITVPRPIELVSLKWKNINFRERIATVEENVVKKDRIHLIPLSRQALNILNELKEITGHSDYVFPNMLRSHRSKNPHMATGTILRVIEILGFANRASGHGFRHQFLTVLNDKGFNRDWIEKQLNHEECDVRGIYNHAQYLEGRRQILQWYADYIDGLTT